MPASAYSIALWEAEKKAGKKWGQVAKENAAKHANFAFFLSTYPNLQKTGTPAYWQSIISEYLDWAIENPPGALKKGKVIWKGSVQKTLLSSAAKTQAYTAFDATLPHKPPDKIKAIAGDVFKTALKTGVTVGVGGALGSAASGLGTTLGNTYIGEDAMGFFDEIGGAFDQVSSLIKKGEGVKSQVKNFGKGGSGGGGGTSNPALTGIVGPIEAPAQAGGISPLMVFGILAIVVFAMRK